MKALTLTQPWASLVASGAKRVETRSWRTGYRGPLAIHAAKTFPADARALCHVEPFRSRLIAALLDEGMVMAEALPLGQIVGITWVEDCVPTVEADVGDEERAFGNFAEGRWAWKLREPEAFTPIKYRGALGLWDLADEVVPERYRLAIRHPGQ